MKIYVIPQVEVQIISVSQLMIGSSNSNAIQKGDPVPVTPGGIYV